MLPLFGRLSACAKCSPRIKSWPAGSALEQKYDKQFKAVFGAIRALMESPEAETKKRAIGFLADHGE